MNINFDTEVVKKILDIFSGMSVARSIIMTLCLVIMLVVYLSAGSWTTYIEHRLNDPVQINTKVYELPTDKRKSVESVLNRYIKKYNDNIAMILVYKFIPDGEVFYQSRVLVSCVTNPAMNLVIDKYNLKILNFGAVRAQIDDIMAGKPYIVSLDDVINKYLVDGYPHKDKYMSPMNLREMYNDGMKFLISSPVENYRAIGYVSVYYKHVPLDDEHKKEYLSIAKSIAGEAGYYIAY